jgi:regulator of protease activity HflC (stomatin/prohibitin superfamily)
MKRKLIIIGVILLVITVISLIIANSTFLTIDAGFRAVVFRPFTGGLDKKNIYKPGFHLISPWNRYYVYDIRESQIEESMNAVSINGSNVKLYITARINPIYDKIGDLHERFGVNYITKLIKPEIRSVVKNIIGRYKTEELYSSKREEVQNQIRQDLKKVLGDNFVDLRAILIRDIELPEKAKLAIEEKIEAEQKLLKYEILLEQERKEKERLLIEASGKSEANTILSAGLTNQVLAEKGIEATLKLANSPNAKIVIIGNDKNGLPLILGNQ